MNLIEMRQFILDMTPEMRLKIGWPEKAEDVPDLEELAETMSRLEELGALTTTPPEVREVMVEHPEIRWNRSVEVKPGCEFCENEATWGIRGNQGQIHLWCDDCDPEVREVNMHEGQDTLTDATRLEDLKEEE